MASKTRDIKTRLVLSGDKEYADKLKTVNAELSSQKAKMKDLQEQYKSSQNSQEALRKKIEQLTEIQRSQTKVLQTTKEGLANATKEYSKYHSIVNDIEEKIQRTQIALEKVNGSTEEGSKQQRDLNEQLEEYQRQLSEAHEKEKAAEKAVDAWSTKHSKAQGSISRTNTQLIEYKNYLAEAENSTDKCAKSIDEYGHKVKKAAEKQKEFDGRLDSSEAAIGSLAATLAATGINKKAEEIIQALEDCISASAEFQTAIAKISTIADTTKASMDSIKNGIVNLSNEMGKGVAELSEATYNAISAGVDTAGAVEFVAIATKLATGGFTDNTTAVDILTTVLNAYNMELSEAGKASDYLIMTQNLGKTTVAELASSLGKVIPIASTYNVEMDNLSSAMAILTSRGIATAEATTYMKAALNELGDSGKAVSGVLEERTGMSFANLMKQGYSLGDVMDILGKAVDYDKGAFNELWSSSEAGIAALSLLSAGTDNYNSVLKKMREGAGATGEAYEKMANTTEMAQRKFSNAFFNLKAAIGDKISEQFADIADKGTQLLEVATRFVQENDWIVPVIEGIIGATAALAAAVTTVTIGMQVAIPIIKAFTLVLSANPFVAVATAIGVLAATIVPMILSMKEGKNEIDLMTESMLKQTDALNASVEAYKDQEKEEEQNLRSVRELKDQLDELIAKEEKTTAEKEAIASIVDKLNEKIPELNLRYDELNGTLNLTTEQYRELYEQMEKEQNYKVAKDNYTQVYAERQRVLKNQKQAMSELEQAYKNIAELQSIMDMGEEMQEEAYAASLAIEEQKRNLENLEKVVRENTAALGEADEQLAAMTYDINLYVIETANMTTAERRMIDAQLESAGAIRENTEEYYAKIEAIAKTASTLDSYANEVRAKTELIVEQMKEISEAYDENYAKAYESISGQIGLFKTMKTESSISVKEMIKSLDSQVEYMEKYAENMQKAMEMGVSEGLLAKLSDGSEESAGILQEIVNSSEKKIEELNEKFEKVSEGKDKFAETMAELKTYYGQELEGLISDTEKAVSKMAHYDKAYAAAQETCNGLMKGVDDKWDSVIQKYKALSEAVMKAYTEPQDTHSPSKKFIYFSEMSMEGIEDGVDRREDSVLRRYRSLSKAVMDAYEDGMREAESGSVEILVAEKQNRKTQERYESGRGTSTTNNTVSNQTTQTFNIYTPVKTPSELMREARLAEQYGLAGE